MLDTNGYRDLTFGLTLPETRAKAQELRQAEEKAGIMSLANPFVIWELIGHLGDTSDPAYTHCLHGLVALADHTWSRTDSNGGVCTFADPETTVCRELFRRSLPGAAKNVQEMCKLAAYVRDNAPEITLPAAVNNLKVFAAKLIEKEKSWLSDLQSVLDQCKPNLARPWVGGKADKDVSRRLRAYFRSDAFMEAWSVITVQRHARLVDVTLDFPAIADRAKVVREIFPTAFYLLLELLEKFPTPKSLDLLSKSKNRGNFLWDSAICNSVGAKHDIDGAPMYLVTADKAIKRAATKAGCPDKVLSLSEHLTAVGIH